MAVFARYCKCGGSLKGRISPDRGIEGLHEIWQQAHSGPGHEPTDAKGAAAARRREERGSRKSRKDW